MSKILDQNSKSIKRKILKDDVLPVSLNYSSGYAAQIFFSDGTSSAASCLRCIDSPCMTYHNDELESMSLEGYPADKNPSVCASSAISINSETGAPIINSDDCFYCGVCASRCPVGAISFELGYGAIINDLVNESFSLVSEKNLKKINETQNLFSSVVKKGEFLKESDDYLVEIFKKLEKSIKKSGDQFPNLLARNLLLAVNLSASMGRKGNNHMRMDLIFSNNQKMNGIVEVEFGQDASLDAPRDILDSLAVLVSRYKWSLPEARLMIISDLLPNKRSEYWHIIYDIKKILGVKISTITIFSLMLLIWNKKYLDLENQDIFYVDKDTNSYKHSVLEKLIGRSLNITKSILPQIEVVK